MPADMRARLAGKPWRIQFRGQREDGNCNAAKRLIVVRRSLRGRRLLEVLVHEILHAEHWQIDEYYVQETAKDIARVLSRAGFKQVYEQ